MSEQPQEPKQEITQVTKVRNAGRVAAGHRLVECNKKNKENLLKNKVEEPTSSTDKSPHEPRSISAKSYDAYLYGVGAIVLLAIVGYVYFQKKPTPSSSQPIPQTSPAAESKRGVFEME